MTGLPKVLLMLLSWLLFAVLWWFIALKDCCPVDGGQALTDADTTAQETVEPVLNLPLAFLWDSSKAYTGADFASFKAGFMEQEGAEEGILEIVGLYHESEIAPEGYANMGFARADSIRALFPEIPDDRIKLSARTILDEKEGVRENYFTAHIFNWLPPEKQEAGVPTVQKLEDRIIIRFPLGSTKKDYDKSVDQYLLDLAKRVKDTNEKIILTGHTDNQGTAEFNLKLGQGRSDAIKGILVGHGVDDGLITTDSKGLTQPVSTNETEEGRHDNRRVEVRLIKTAKEEEGEE